MTSPVRFKAAGRSKHLALTVFGFPRIRLFFSYYFISSKKISFPHSVFSLHHFMFAVESEIKISLLKLCESDGRFAAAAAKTSTFRRSVEV